MLQRLLRISAWIGVVYVGLALALTALIAVVQPQPEGRIVVVTYDASNTPHPTVLRQLQGGQGEEWLWSRRWFRSWFHRAVEQGCVTLDIDGEQRPRSAREVTQPEALQQVLATQREQDGARSWWFNRAVSLFAPIRLLELGPHDGECPGGGLTDSVSHAQ